MATIFDVFFEYKIGGILPLWIPVGIFVIGLIIWLIATRKPRQKEYKPIDMKKEIKNDLDVQYKYFAEAIQRPLYSGMTKVAMVAGFIPLIWQERKYYKILKRKIKGEEKTIEIQTSESEALKTSAKIKTVDNPIDLICLKIYYFGLLNKIKAIMGFGFKYFIFKKEDISFDEDSVNINTDLQRQYFFGQFVFSKASKSILDNTSFKIDRENQLQEIANQIPRTVFFDTEISKQVTRAREAAKIEKERFKAQKESMED